MRVQSVKAASREDLTAAVKRKAAELAPFIHEAV